jgi:hypothetical protein
MDTMPGYCQTWVATGNGANSCGLAVPCPVHVDIAAELAEALRLLLPRSAPGAKVRADLEALLARYDASQPGATDDHDTGRTERDERAFCGPR